MVIFSRSARSCVTSAGCALSAAAWRVQMASYACRSPWLNAASISASHSYGDPSSTLICRGGTLAHHFGRLHGFAINSGHRQVSQNSKTPIH